MRKLLLLLMIILGTTFGSRASHVMGGEITWECQGGSYVFQLVFYRDCNGADVNTVSEIIRVWNHSTVTQIVLPFVQRIDISPTCSPVAGSPVPFACGAGNATGNGIGAIEKIIYRSAPIALAGNPGIDGWIFTYENFSRSGSLTNINNPTAYGITLAAKMFNHPEATGACADRSPVFLQEPYFVSCAGTPYRYNMNAVDYDLDSLSIEFGIPYNNFPTGIYNPPTNPAAIPYEPGFAFNNPTPGPGLNPGNIPAALDNSSGELTFTSFSTGNFVVKVLIRSYRNGFLIAEVEREMQLIVVPCVGANNPPVINGPFAGLFETTIVAGSLVNFNLSATDVEFLQDGSPQSNWLTASGFQFGTGFTSPTDCETAPCATLNTAPLISGVQGVNTTFNWQTSCDHLVGANGNALDLVPYHFVFRVQDDFCQVPKVSYATITINVVNPGVIPAPQIDCIQSDIAGNVTINWNSVTDPFGTFEEYRIYSVQNGLLGVLPAIGSSSFTHNDVVQQNDYYIGVVSGCNGNTTRYSDTLSNIHLALNNPSDGTAVLQWNDPVEPANPGMGAYYHIYREYPAGTWTLIDSVPYGLNFYKDTIDICEAFLRYRIVLPNVPCDFISNAPGDDFEDMLTPDIPLISSVSIDTLTGNVVINWNENSQDDTYGYVIYTFDQNGFIYELDTVWGIGSTSYTHIVNTSNGPLTYSVAAFDSCFTSAVIPTYQTSAKADIHTTIFTENNLNICDNTVVLTWTPYVGWNNLIDYQIWQKENTGLWTAVGTSTTLSFTVSVEDLTEYCFFIEARSSEGISSFSNFTCLNVGAPNPPGFHYLQVATVENEQVRLEHLIDISTGIQGIQIEKQNSTGQFIPLIQLPATQENLSYVDSDVEVGRRSYTYRTRVIDSCGRLSAISNSAQTIYLQQQKDDVRLLNYLFWNAYSEFDGSILAYNIYRGIDGVFDGTPLTTLPNDQLAYTDDLNDVTFTGKVCYYVEAIEGSNVYNDPKISRSNVTCQLFEPIIYIPNAFVPEGFNSCFFPVITNFNPINYRMVIFDRWGQEIFHTTTPTDKWCGYIRDTDNMAETATYVYMITLSDGDGNEIVKRGHVTLLK
jgi:hypothetical protein